MLVKTQGVILNVIKYNDNSFIVKMFTLDYGLKSFMVYKSKARGKKNRTNVFQSLSILDIEISGSENKGLQKLKGFHTAYPFNSLCVDPVKISIGIFLTEILVKTIKEEEKNEGLYNFIISSVKMLEHIEGKVSNFHLMFLVKLAKFLGFFPLNNYSDQDNCFNLMNGKFAPNNSGNVYIMNTKLSSILLFFVQKKYSDLEELVVSRTERNDFLDCLLDYYKLHIENFKEVKSYSVLKSIFI